MGRQIARPREPVLQKTLTNQFTLSILILGRLSRNIIQYQTNNQKFPRKLNFSANFCHFELTDQLPLDIQNYRSVKVM